MAALPQPTPTHFSVTPTRFTTSTCAALLAGVGLGCVQAANVIVARSAT